MTDKKRSSLQGKLNKVIGLSLILSLLIMAVAVNIIERRSEREKLLEELRVISDILGNKSIAPLRFFDSDTARKNLESARFHPSIDSICLYSTNGNLFARYTRKETESCASEHAMHTIGVDDQHRLHAGIFVADKLQIGSILEDKGSQMGMLLLTANQKALLEEQFRLTLMLLGVFSFAFILTYFLIRGLLRNLLKPLNSLYATALTVSSEGNKGERATRMSNDEVGALVDVFNEMLNRLAADSEALLQSESRFRILAENAPIGIYLKNQSGKILYVNEKWCEITGFDKKISKVDYINSVDEEDIYNYERFLSNISELDETRMLEYQFRGKEGLKSSKLMEYVTPILVQKDKIDAESPVIGSPAGYIGTVVDVTELKDAQIELERLAFYDPLTNLPNRRYVRDALERLIQQSRGDNKSLAIALVDLDNFKRVNDSLGHDAGDMLLSVLADRLRQRLNKNDIVARMGGDEFYVIVSDINDKTVVDTITKRISAALSQPVRIKNHFVEVSVSIGVAFYPENANGPEELIRNADIALYRAKDQGKDCVAYFSGEMEEDIRERMKLESRLRQAVFDNDLEIYIQPQYNAKDNTFGWGEVLLRWYDSEEGFIPPDRFIPIAEETGIINYIDEWVLRAACQVIRDHGEALEAKGIKGLSVNLSAKQFYSKDLLKMVKKTFADFGVPPQKISFEVTESMVIEDVDGAISTMRDIRELGCSLSMDDFGTGYSSLSYLKRLPLDNLKIDRSFISDIPQDANDVAITQAILAMAEKLNIAVIAEGIETAEQRDFLIAHECYFMQGYFFAMPMPVSKLLEKDSFMTG